MLVPREGDSVRFYVQLSKEDVMSEDGRADRSRVSVESILQVRTRFVFARERDIDFGRERPRGQRCILIDWIGQMRSSGEHQQCRS